MLPGVIFAYFSADGSNCSPRHSSSAGFGQSFGGAECGCNNITERYTMRLNWNDLSYSCLFPKWNIKNLLLTRMLPTGIGFKENIQPEEI